MKNRLNTVQNYELFSVRLAKAVFNRSSSSSTMSRNLTIFVHFHNPLI